MNGRLAQLTDIVDLPDVDRVAEEIILPESNIIKRAVALKTLRGAVMVRKIVLWKTNKEDASKDFPAFVMQLTDFLPNRAEQVMASPIFDKRIKTISYDHAPREAKLSDHSLMILEL